MLQILRIALFRPDAKEDEVIGPLFQRHEYSLRTVTSGEEVLQLTHEEGAPFDAVVIPLRLSDGTSGISACLQLKSVEELASLPVLGISLSNEKPIIQTFFEVGADVVLLPPIDADFFWLQLGALSRQHQAFGEQIRKKSESSGFSRSIITAFDIVREGLIIFNTNFELSFANASARILLGLSTPTEAQQTLGIDKLFRQMLVQHEKISPGKNARHSSESQPVSRFETSLTRVDGRSFRASVRITRLYAADGIPMGFAASITDLSELDQLSNSLLQAQRTRSLCLLTAAFTLHSLGSSGTGAVLSPLTQIEDLLQKETLSSPVNPILTSLMELLDLVISPDITVKVSAKQDIRVAIPPADLFQLLGHLILHAVQLSGKAGEALIEVGGDMSGKGIPVVLVARSRKVTPFIPNDYLSNLIQGEFSETVPAATEQNGSEDKKMNVGLAAVQEIALKYGTTVEFHQPDEATTKLRVKLPTEANK